MNVYNNGNLNNNSDSTLVQPSNNAPKKKPLNKQQLIILGVIGLSCLAVILGFGYSYYKDGGGSLFGSNNSPTGTGMTGFEVADEVEDSITDYVSPDILEEWTAEAEDTLDEYVPEEDEAEEDTSSNNTNTDSNSNSNNESNSDSNSNSNNESNSGSNSNSDDNSSSDNETKPSTPSETLGKGEWLAKYYDGGVLRYYADGSVYDMTRNIWWTKTQWNDFMASITQ